MARDRDATVKTLLALRRPGTRRREPARSGRVRFTVDADFRIYGRRYLLSENMNIQDRIKQAVDRLASAVTEFEPIAVFALFSGGHDSFSSSYIASLSASFSGAVHINTGIGIPGTRDYVRDTANARGWRLLEYKATENVKADGTPDPQIYADIVRAHGFPGPFGHRMMYSKLKERQLRRLERDVGASGRGKKPKRIIYVSGCRSAESNRRMANTDEVNVDGRRVWVAPIHDWTKADTNELLEVANQPRNLIVDLIHKSGECLCGAFAKKTELAELNLWPQTRPAYDAIVKLQEEIGPRFGWGWGERPLKNHKTQPGLFGTNALCWSCDKAVI
jgi:3'-phosphoadenosine 5'-phosphosulfate sulfotransferase (PAPS reductase)/FAD synthetase